MFEEVVVSRDKHRCNVNEDAAQLNSIPSLVGSSHEQDAVCRNLDRPMLQQGAFTRGIGVYEGLSQVRVHVLTSGLVERN